MAITTQETSFTKDVIGRYVCNTFDEAKSTDFRRFNIIIIGGGSFGGAMAEQLFDLDRKKRHRILVLEAGLFELPEHIQNFPPMHAGLGPPDISKLGTIEELRADWASKNPGQQVPALLPARNEAWGLPWHSRTAGLAEDPKDKRFPGLAYCVGGRSLFWGGWSPQLIDSELTEWPSEVVTELKAQYFNEAKCHLGTDTSNDFIHGPLHDELRGRLFAGIGTITDSVGVASENDLEAPLAVQSRQVRAGIFPFNKYSSVPLLMDASRLAEFQKGGNDSGKRLMIVPRCHVRRIELDALNRVTRIHTNIEPIDVLPNSIVIIALGTVESTRLAQLSFPDPHGLIGKNLMAHLRSNTTFRIPGSSFVGLPAELEASALFVKGKNAKGHFHLQMTACGVRGNVADSEAELNKKIPNIDEIDRLKRALDTSPEDYVVVTARGIGEMESNRTPASISRIDLDPEVDENGVRRAIATMGLTQKDKDLWDEMDKAAEQVAKALAKGAALQYFNESNGQWEAARWTKRDGLGSTHHEGGTLWMDPDPKKGVTDTIGRFHGVSNAFAVGPALFPTVGSPNPMLGGVALVRRTARVLVGPDTKPAADAGFTSIFDGTNMNGWKMAGPGQFILEPDEFGRLRADGGLGLLWYSTKKYKNFQLRLEWQASGPYDNSGVFVRFPDPGTDPWVAVNQGYEIQIDDMGAPSGTMLHSTGSIYGFSAAKRLASRLVGEWNTFEIKVVGQTYDVTLNKVPAVTGFTGTRGIEGYIGLQNHGAPSRVSFRNIRIKEL